MNFFPSFSIIINSLIIFVFKFLKRGLTVRKKYSYRTVIFAYAIIIILSSAIIGGFVYILDLSFKRDSNLETIAKVSKNIEFYTPLEAANGTDLNQSVQLDCLSHFQIQQENSLTLYDLFKANGINPSYAFRQKLAANVEIVDYTGKAEQNSRLLIILKDNDNIGRLYCQMPLIKSIE